MWTPQRHGSDTHNYTNRSGRPHFLNRSKSNVGRSALNPIRTSAFAQGRDAEPPRCFGLQNLRPGRNPSSIPRGQAEEERLPARGSLRPPGETSAAASTDPRR
ncbi:hypothetical protein FQA47_022213 [Oryzias melastigma]|uniref:Uncharacterized protein n=1 Tax=Oryzias melastigma TaxID=30732 RepID=A0A834FMW7_ORYME|nr:hypothetical protein FQA47_022213 [Oryzias melastigma]